MMRLKLLCATVITFGLINGVSIGLPMSHPGQWLNKSEQAYARSSGGRSGGGSFGSRSSSSSSGSSSRSSLSRSSGSDSNGSYSRGFRYRSGYTYVAAPLDPLSATITAIAAVLIFVFVVWIILSFTRSKNKHTSSHVSSSAGNSELGNNIVTVNKLQVALLSEARAIQSQLSNFSLSADTNTPEGLRQLLQESALALLQTPEYWTHVFASSQAVQRHHAEQIFNRFSIEERSKLSAETLVNVSGRTRNQPVQPDPNEDPPAYIVVTLLIGTEDDKRLFGEIWSKEELQQALERVAAVPSDYLLKFELLWSPQAETDSLTYDELLSEYTTMVQI